MHVAGATVFRGLEGYGGSAEIHRPHLIGSDLPTIISVVDTAENIGRLAPALEVMMDKGVIVTSDVMARRIGGSET